MQLLAFGTEPDGDTDRSWIDIVIVTSLFNHLNRDRFSDTLKWLHSLQADERFGVRLLRFSSDELAQDVPSYFNCTNHSRNLLDCLRYTRRNTDEQKRPLIFLSYSFGCIVVKQLLYIAESGTSFRDIFDATVGVIFIAAIHQHSHALFEQCMLRCAAVESDNYTSDRIFRQRSWTDFLTRWKTICQNFQTLHMPFPVTTIYELEETEFRRGRVRKKTSSQIIPREIATLDVIEELVVGTNVDHVSLFSALEDNHEHITLLISQVRKIFDDVYSNDLQRRFGQSTLSETISLTQGPSLLSRRQTTVQPYTHTTTNVICHMLEPFRRNPNFVGRKDLLELIQKTLNPSPVSQAEDRSIVLHGAGGIGKTQTALAYVFGHLDKFPAILLAQAQNREKLLQSYADYAFELGLVDDITVNQETCLKLVKRWFAASKSPWLVVFDNADATNIVDVIDDFWPHGSQGSVLVTSRNKSLVGTFARVGEEIGKLSEQEGIDLLGRMSQRKDSEKDAIAIIKQIGLLPLALSSAGIFIRTKSLRYSEYLKAYNTRILLRNSIPLKGPAYRYDFQVSNAWNINFQALDPDTETFVNMLAFMDPEIIQEDLIKNTAAKGNEPKLKFLSDEKRYLESRATLLDSSLVSHNEEAHFFSMHRVIQETCHIRMGEQARQDAFELGVKIVHSAWPIIARHDRHQQTNWEIQQKHINHIVSLGTYYDDLKLDMKRYPSILVSSFAELLQSAAWYYYERGQYSPSERLIKLASSSAECLTKDSELILADISGTLASIQTEISQLEQALYNFQKQHEYLEKAFQNKLLTRPDSREPLVLGGLANGYLGLDRYEEAESYYRRCLQVWKDHPGDPALYQMHLGECLTMQGRYTEAEEVLTTLIADRAARLKPLDTTSFRTGIAYYNLGRLRDKQQLWDKASEAYEISVDLLRKTLGDNHFSTGDALYKFAWHLCRENKNEEAIPLLEEALKIYSETLYCQKECNRIRYKLGIAYQAVGKTEKGESFVKKSKELLISWGEGVSEPITESLFDQQVNCWSR